MSFSDGIDGLVPAPRKVQRRGYQAAQISRLVSSWTTVPKPADADIRAGLRIARARCRDAAQNNDYVKHYLRLTKSNVIGHAGIMLKPRSQDDNGNMDAGANDAIKEAFTRWSTMGIPDVTGRLSWIGIQQLFLETVAKDGECFIRKHPNWERNEFRYALEFIDAEAVDPMLTKDLGNGRVINMGIELDEWRRPAAYYVRTLSATSDIYEYNGNRYKRIPAEQIIHGFLPDSSLQTRGFPWLAISLMRTHMLKGYEEAELVAARTASAKMGFFEVDPNAPGDAEYEGEEDADGAMLTDAEPGSLEMLPPGYKFNSWDPQHPTTAFDSFIKANLRGMAAGLGVSYFSLANDLTGVNYSSGRLGSLEDREVWKALQSWLIDILVRPIVEEWLALALLAGQITLPTGRPLPAQKLRKFKRIHYQGRRWPWVDPKNDLEAQGIALDRKLTSPQRVIIEQGNDPGEILDDWKEWEEMRKARGLEMTTVTPTTQEAPGNAEENA